MKSEHQIRRKEKEEEKFYFTEIIEAQKKEKEIVKVIKQKELMVRDTVDKRKKCIVIYGLKEETEPVRYKREKEQKKGSRGHCKKYTERR